jgi:hypothetical protein
MKLEVSLSHENVLLKNVKRNIQKSMLAQLGLIGVLARLVIASTINELLIENVYLDRTVKQNHVLAMKLKKLIVSTMSIPRPATAMAPWEYSRRHVYLDRIFILMISASVNPMKTAVLNVLSGLHGVNGLLSSHLVSTNLIQTTQIRFSMTWKSICQNVFVSVNVNLVMVPLRRQIM